MKSLWRKVKLFYNKLDESPETMIRFLLITAAYGFPLGMLSGGIVMYVGQGMNTFLLLLLFSYVFGGYQAWKSINRS